MPMRMRTYATDRTGGLNASPVKKWKGAGSRPRAAVEMQSPVECTTCDQTYRCLEVTQLGTVIGAIHWQPGHPSDQGPAREGKTGCDG